MSGVRKSKTSEVLLALFVQNRERKEKRFVLDVLTLVWLEDVHINMQIGPGERLGPFRLDLGVSFKG